MLLLDGRERPAGGGEFLHLAAVAALTEVAVQDARDEVEQNVRGGVPRGAALAPPAERRRDPSAAAPRSAATCVAARS